VGERADGHVCAGTIFVWLWQKWLYWCSTSGTSSRSSSSVVGTAAEAAVTLKLPVQHQPKEVRMIAQMKTV